jgi:transposase-like protein
MYTMDETEVMQPTRRRRHSKEFKAQAIRATMQPNVSIAAVTLHYRLNANMLRSWVAAQEELDAAEVARKSMGLCCGKPLRTREGQGCAGIDLLRVRDRLRRCESGIEFSHWPDGGIDLWRMHRFYAEVVLTPFRQPRRIHKEICMYAVTARCNDLRAQRCGFEGGELVCWLMTTRPHWLSRVYL